MMNFHHHRKVSSSVLEKFFVNALDIAVNFVLSVMIATTSYIVGIVLHKYGMEQKNIFRTTVTLEEALFHFEVTTIIIILSLSVLAVAKENVVFLFGLKKS